MEWTQFAQQNGLWESPFESSTQFYIDETPLVVHCQLCSTSVLASAFSSHYGDILYIYLKM